MRRVDINPTAARSMSSIVERLREEARNGATVPHGQKDMGETGNSFWLRPDGTYTSVREVDEGLGLAQDRIEDAVISLDETQTRLDQAEQTVTIVQGDLNTLETVTLPGAVSDLEQADQAAQEQFTELDTRLDGFATDEALAPIRQALTDAQAAVEAAQGVAQTANEAANAASQAALEAAGIAASKGRVIVQETEPTGEDRNAANIWIKPVPDDPDTEIEEKAVTYVYLADTDEWQPTTSSELAQAAQNALDAREAAQQAQQRADTAIANAAAAQGAAEAAQRTADQATLDARDAHNEAVAAQERLDAKIASGDSLIINGSFESGALGWPSYIADNTHPRAGIVEDPDARTGTHTLRLTPVDSNTYPESTPLLAVTPGQVLNFRGWWKHLGGDGTMTRMLIRTHDAAGAYVSIKYPSMRTDVQDWPIGEWILQEGDYVVEEGIRFLSFAPHATVASTSEYRVDDLQVIDVTEARAAQAAAQEAYELAESKLDESEIDDKIIASANGKNSLTISTVAPDGDGVVIGDTWWQMDYLGQIFAQFQWLGDRWFPTTVRSEVIANLDVHKLTGTEGDFETFFAENFTASEAVIENVWAGGIAARAVTAGSATIAPGNMIPWTPRANGSDDIAPHNAYGAGAEYIRWGYDADMGGQVLVINMAAGSTASRFAMQLHPTVDPTDLVTEFGGNPFPVRGDTDYRLEFGLGAGGNYPDGRPVLRASFYVYNHAGERIGIVGSGDLADETGSTSLPFTNPKRFGATVRMPEGAAFANVFLSASNSGFIYLFEPELRPLVGAVQIQDGAITTPKLTVTEDMSAAIVSAMSVNTKKLVVTDEAILNHATLIGQTVVDDINVQGKLIGEDGVFTGTVDFENINVTGTALIEKLQGNTISGASISTPYTNGTRIVLSNIARDGWPALSFETGGEMRPAALAAYDGQQTDLGVWPNGTLVMNSGRRDMDGASTSAIAAGDELVTILQRSVAAAAGGRAYFGLSGPSRASEAPGTGVNDTASVPAFAAGNGIAGMWSPAGSLYADLQGSVWRGGPLRGEELYTRYIRAFTGGNVRISPPKAEAGWGMELGTATPLLRRWDSNGVIQTADDIDLLGAGVGEWHDVPLNSGWQPRTSGGYYPGLRVRRNGKSLEINGAVQSGASGSVIGTIDQPELCPTYATFVISTLAGGGTGQSHISSTGNISHSYGANAPGFLAINVTIPLN